MHACVQQIAWGSAHCINYHAHTATTQMHANSSSQYKLQLCLLKLSSTLVHTMPLMHIDGQLS